MALAFMQRLAGDTAGAKATAEQARNTLEQLYKDQPDNFVGCATSVSSLCRDGREGLGSKGSGTGDRASARVPKIGWTDLAWKKTWHSFRRSSARIAVPSRFSASCYKRPIVAGFTAQRPSRRRFLGSIRSGIRCAVIPLSKSSARKSSGRHELHESSRILRASTNWCKFVKLVSRFTQQPARLLLALK